MRTIRLLTATTALTLLLSATPVGSAPGPPSAQPVDRSSTATPTGRLDTETHALTEGGARAGRPAAGWTTTVPVAPGTQMVGLSWTGSDAVDLEIRARTGDGGWDDWVDLHADLPDAGGTGRLGAGPAWLGSQGTDEVEVRIVSGEPADLRLEAMSHTTTATRARRAVDHPATPAGGPPIRTRSEWAPGGWRGDLPGCTPSPLAMDRLRFGVVHHTVSSNTYSQSDVPGLLAGIYRFHTGTNRWCDIAYNFFVDRFGRVWQGRSGSLHDPVMGGHARGFNTHSVGVALLGQHQPGASPAGASPSGAAMTALRDVLAWKLSSHGVDPRATIPIVSQGSPRYPAGRTVHLPAVQGHRDSGLTSCPGDLAYGRLAQLRQDTFVRILTTAATSRWAPSTTGAAFFDRLLDDAYGRDIPNGPSGRRTSLVVRAGYSRDGLARDVVFASITDQRIGTVDRLYRAAFGRPPDIGGLPTWVRQRDRGRSVLGVAHAFSATPEFEGRYDGLGDPAFVDAIYRNVLGRPADPSGRDYWVGRLRSGMTRYQLLAHFSESPEHRYITHRETTLTRAWFAMLDRAPAPADRDYWRGRFAAGADSLDLVRVLLRSAEYARGA